MDAVIDTNIILHGRRGFDLETIYIVPEVQKEIKSSEGSKRIKNMDLEILQPDGDILSNVQKKSNEINSPTSETDEKLVALSWSIGKTLMTDDKAMQNLAKMLDVDFIGYMEDEIEETIKWKTVCRNCGKEVANPPCPQCGHQRLDHKIYQRS